MFKKNNLMHQTIGVALVFCLLLGGMLFFIKNDGAYKMEEDGFQVVAGTKQSYEKGTKFQFNKNGITYKGADDNIVIARMPIYLENNISKIIVPNESIYYRGIDAYMRKTASFSHIENNQYNGDVNLKSGFIFDGMNSYIFLEKMTVRINGYDIEFGPLSSIFVAGNSAYYYYNTKTNEMKADNILTETLSAKAFDYEIDLMNDILYTAKNEKVLLYGNPEDVEELK